METDLAMHARRRKEFAESLGDGIAVIPAAAETTRNDDVHHAFRQDSDFYFLTGFDEPDAVAIIDPSSPTEQYVLFVRPRDREREIWDGYRAGVDGAKEQFGADAAFPLSDLDAELRRRLAGRPVAYVPFRHSAMREKLASVITSLSGLRERFGRTIPDGLRDASVILQDLRLVKSDAEIAALKTACAISAEGHAEAMRYAAAGRYEYQVQAAMELVFRLRGSRRDGYPAIVASGPNACVLHYTENDRRLETGDLLLIDAGAEYRYFSADITRTFPVSGAFSPPQRAVYDVVLAAHQAALALARPESSMRAVHDASVDAITEGLVALGLLPGPVEQARRMHHYREFFMHGTGHWLGMDVHDAGSYGVDGKPRPLRPGMAFTVEPGIYVAPDRPEIELTLIEYDIDEWTERRLLVGQTRAKEIETEEMKNAPKVTHRIPDEFLGIGVRIEDDVLITAEGHENLTAAVPTAPDDIESLCAEDPRLAGAID